MAGSVLGLFYYLRVISTLFATSGMPVRSAAPARGGPAIAGNVVLGALAVLLVWFGVYPDPATHLIRATAMLLP